MPEYELIKQVVYTVDELLSFFELEENPKVLDRVDNIIIQFPNQRIYLGIICYNNVKLKYDKRFKKLYATPDSLDFEKVKITQLLLKHINDLLIDGIRPITINGRLHVILNFIEYLKINSFELKLNRISIQSALVNYSQHLLHQIKIYDKELKLGLTTGTAHNYQNWIVTFCAYTLKTDTIELLNDHYIIGTNNNERVSTQALSNEDCEIQFSQYTSIFRRFSSIVLDHEIFPLTFTLDQEIYWVTHLGSIKHSDSDYLSKPGVFNYSEGRKYTIDEIISAKRSKKRSRINETINKQKQQREKSNTPYSASRLKLAYVACKAYFMQFLFLTGENDSTAASLLFNKIYTVENSNINFKSIKWRANGRAVKYDIQSEFMQDFKVYLRLRSYLLKHYNVKHKELFLDVINQKLAAPTTTGKHSSKIREYFSGKFVKNTFDSTSKSIRVTKGLWIRNNHGSSLSSYILQHSGKASNASYTSSNFENSSEELTNYFSQLSNQLLLKPGKEESTPSGKCIEPNMPQEISTIISNSLITPDCRDQKSCFFCSKYRVHGDDIDIRKLLSMQYFVLQSEHIAHSIEHFKSVYDFLLTRIDAVLCQIKGLGEEQAKMIADVKKQVFEQEELSDYWYRKLELLDKLGVL